MNTRRIAHAFFGLIVLAAAVMAGCDDKKEGGGTASGGSNSKGAATKPSGEGTSSSAKPRIAFITNCVDPFWVIAEKGVRDAAAKYNAEATVIMPDGISDQKQKLEDMLIRGVDGVAISPLDADNQTPLIDSVAAKTRVITHDSDAPKSKRLMYIGVDNYAAGRMAGELVKEAIPNGGKVAIFVGMIEQDNAQLRRQGVIDALLDRPVNPKNRDPVFGEIKGSKYTIVATLTDQKIHAKAKNNAEDMITLHSDLACMVGLFAYNPPLCLEALKSRNKIGKIALVGFDEDEGTLQAIKDGQCYGTVVQNPYMYGHESVRVLASLVRGNNTVIPASKFLEIPARKIKKDIVDEYWADLRKKTGK